MVSSLSGFGMWVLLSISDIQTGKVPDSVRTFFTEQQCLDAKKEQEKPELWTCQLSDPR